MLSESLRRRLEMLNRGLIPANPTSPAPSDPLPSAIPSEIPPSLPNAAAPLAPTAPTFDWSAQAARWYAWRTEIVPNLPEPRPAQNVLPLEGTEVNFDGTRYWLVQQPLHEFWLPAREVLARSHERWNRHDTDHSASHLTTPKRDRLRHELDHFRQAFPQRVMFLDLETCGLGGSAIFLVGLLVVEHETWQLKQLWARNYAEEAAILHALWRIAMSHDVLVTFNGKTFDWPQVHARSTIHKIGRDPQLRPRVATDVEPSSDDSANHLPASRLGPDDERPRLIHLDLLHHARRRWKDELPDCRLQTLERALCGRVRYDDIPGRLIPAAYHDYVRTQDSRQVRRVLHHNLLDLLTLLQVTIRVMDSDEHVGQVRESVRTTDVQSTHAAAKA